jgi:hypothetical protein
MNKHLYFIGVLFSLFLFSCEEGEQAEPSGTLENVEAPSLDMRNRNGTTVSFTASVTDPPDGGELHYALIRENDPFPTAGDVFGGSVYFKEVEPLGGRDFMLVSFTGVRTDEDYRIVAVIAVDDRHTSLSNTLEITVN